MRHIFSIICLAASTLTMQAQVKETLTSPNGKVKIEINADKELTFSIIDDANTYYAIVIRVENRLESIQLSIESIQSF